MKISYFKVWSGLAKMFSFLHLVPLDFFFQIWVMKMKIEIGGTQILSMDPIILNISWVGFWVYYFFHTYEPATSP